MQGAFFWSNIRTFEREICLPEQFKLVPTSTGDRKASAFEEHLVSNSIDRAESDKHVDYVRPGVDHHGILQVYSNWWSV